MGRRHDELIEKAGAVPVLRCGAERVLVAQKAEGARVFDVDNVGYIDYIGGGGSSIVGFANQFVLDAARKVLSAGIPEGFHVPLEVELSESLAHFLPWVKSWWFCRSQDDAFRYVLDWARQTTGKKRFLVLDGGAPLRVGAPANIAIDPSNLIRELPGWDVAKIIAAMTSGSTKIAAMIIDPLMGRLGVIPPPDGALKEISEACRDNNVLLVLDERISGFRVHRGGAAARGGITPDVAVYGAALGGGFPIGAVAFRDEQPLLEGYDLLPAPHPVSLAAAEAILSILKNNTVYEHLEKRTGQLVDGLGELAERFSRPVVINQVGSAFALYLSKTAVVDCKSAAASDGDGYRRLASLLRNEGVLLPRQPRRAAFLSSTHGAKDIEETLSAFEKVFLQLHQEDLP
jgi:glutamate-1-semialdehyde 2,1-aminomutase